jgi:hypothetical protein
MEMGRKFALRLDCLSQTQAEFTLLMEETIVRAESRIQKKNDNRCIKAPEKWFGSKLRMNERVFGSCAIEYIYKRLIIGQHIWGWIGKLTPRISHDCLM